MYDSLLVLAAHGAIPPLVHDLAVIMLTAFSVTILFRLIRLPAVLGYILAGILLGPYLIQEWPMLSSIGIKDSDSVKTLADLGVVFLLLCLGMEFSLSQLMKVGVPSFLATLAKALVTTFIGYQAGQLMGFDSKSSIFMGAMLAISSTVICTRLLKDSRRSHEPFGQMVIGILIGQDVLAVVLIAALSTLALSNSVQFSDATWQLVTLTGFSAIGLALGLIFIPMILRRMERFINAETLLLLALALGLGTALLTAKLGFGVALGAFIAGAILSETPHRERLLHLTEPLRDMFLAVFFVATGMLINPAILVQYAPWIAILSVVAILTKWSAGSLGALVAGRKLQDSLLVGATLVPIGEFSFVIADLGRQLNVTDERLHPIAVGLALTTTLAAPGLMRSAEPLNRVFIKRAPQGLQQWMQMYHHWMGQHREDSHTGPVHALLRKMGVQISFNLALVIGLFLAAAALKPWAVRTVPELPESWQRILEWPQSLIWTITLIVCAPILIATGRKLRAACMLFAEFTVARSKAHQHTHTIRKVITRTLFSFGALLISLMILLVSSTLAPSWPIAIALLLIVGVISLVLWEFMIRLYAKAQTMLKETLSSDSESPPHE